MLFEILGWVPAVIFPSATVVQLASVLRAPRVEGVSMTTWPLFGLANICLYLFTEKYLAPQMLIGVLGTAVFDFASVGSIWIKRTTRKAEA